MASSALAVIASVGATPLPENRDYRHRMQIRSESSSRLYTVAYRKATGEWCCSCPGWIRHHGAGISCKHLTRMVPSLAAAVCSGALA